MLDATLPALLTVPAIATEYRTRFLADAASPTSGLVGEALESRPTSDPRHHLGVLARASCLLRLATGATRALLDDAGVTLPDADFWWQDVRARRGVWRAATTAVDLLDQWQDVADAVVELDDYVMAAGAGLTLGDLAEAAPASLLMLGRLEVVPFWELAS
jgi:hypothetical protein